MKRRSKFEKEILIFYIACIIILYLKVNVLFASYILLTFCGFLSIINNIT